MLSCEAFKKKVVFDVSRLKTVGDVVNEKHVNRESVPNYPIGHLNLNK